jgi:hypothetical protein
MVKHQPLSPKPDKQRGAKPPSSRGKRPSLVAGMSDAANQACKNEGRQEQLVPRSFHRLSAFAPFLRLSGDRQSADGVAQVKIECEGWVDRDDLEKLETQPRLIDEKLYTPRREVLTGSDSML